MQGEETQTETGKLLKVRKKKAENLGRTRHLEITGNSTREESHREKSPVLEKVHLEY